MKKNYPSTLFFLLLLLPIFISAQENLSGIINDYTPVVFIEGQCEAVITVADASAFAPGMSVLLIQMQGAQINESNTSAFGTVTDFGSTGLYERNEILSIAGNEITMRYSLANNYDLSGAVQLVSIPTYTSAVVTGTLTAQPWDGSTGGVLVFDAGEQLTINASGAVDVSGLGFRGGSENMSMVDSCSSVVFGGFINEFHYDLNDWRGAQKGEGVAAYIAGKEAGRGQQLNGGGGANSHKTGGGGGAHHTPGGQGGTLNAIGACTGDTPGFGGTLLPNDATRLFMGGGGGGGHSNDGGATNGGNGGGIVIIFSDLITGGGFIRANGENGGNATIAGAGGGGAAGSIVLMTEEFNGLVLIECNGGNGGNTDSQGASACYGPGGGGSGGRIYASASNTNNPGFIGGQAGMVVNSTGTCNGTSNDATAGIIGQVRLLPEFPQNLVESPLVDTVMIADCDSSTGSSVQFNINYPAASSFNYSIGTNDRPISPENNGTLDSLLISNLDSGDSITLIIQAVGANGCVSAYDTVSCLTTTCSGFALAAETNVDSLYCIDDPDITLEAFPAGGFFEINGVEDSTISPATLGVGIVNVIYTYTDSLGCIRTDPFPTRIAEIPPAPSVSCAAITDSTVSFTWTSTAEQYRVVTTINDAPAVIPSIVDETTITFGNLMPGDSVKITLVALGDGACGDSQEVIQTCVAQACPEGTAEIEPIAETICANEAGIQLVATPMGGFFRGQGIDSSGFFNPANVDIPSDSSSVEVALFYEVALEASCPPALDTIFVQVLSLPDTAIVFCDSVAANFIRFAWTHPSLDTFDISYSINGGTIITETGILDTFFNLPNLNSGDEVAFEVSPIGSGACGNPNPSFVSCTASDCGINEATITGLADAYCVDEIAVQLTATPLGGTFSGDGVDSTGFFDPMLANLGSNVISYEFIDSMGCAYQDTVFTEVSNQTPVPDLLCEVTDVDQISFLWSHPTADTFEYRFQINENPEEGLFVTTDTLISVTGLMAGDSITFFVRTIGGSACGNSDFAMTTCEIEFDCDDIVPVFENLAESYCLTEPDFPLQATPAGGVFVLNGTDTITTFMPETIGVGTTTVEYILSSSPDCEQRISRFINIIDPLSPPEITCGDSTAQSLEFSWDNPDNALFRYNVIVAGDTIRTDTTTIGLVSLGGLSPADSALIELIPLDATACIQAQSSKVCYTVECNEEVNATLDLEASYCFANTDIELNANPNTGIFSGEGVDPEGFFNPALAGEGTLTIFYDFTDDIGCPQRDSFTTSIVSTPAPPDVSCGRATGTSANFTWTHPTEGAMFSYAISLDGIDYSPETVSSDTSYTQTSLASNSEVFLRIFTIGPEGCNNSDTIIVSCMTNNCVDVEVNIAIVDDICLGASTEIIDLETDLPDSLAILTTVWSGDGIVDAEEGFLDPNSPELSLGVNLIRFEATDVDGCTYTSSTAININQQPNISITPPQAINCRDTAIMLDVVGNDLNINTTYEWTTTDGNFISAQEDSSSVVNQIGTYVIEVANGSCIALDSVTVVENRTLPIADAGMTQSLGCNADSVILGSNNSSTGAGIVYVWTGPNEFNSNEQFIEVRTPGIYTLIVEDTTNFCASDPAVVQVQNDQDSLTAIVNVSGLINCTNASVTLDASNSQSSSSPQYQWSDANGVVATFSDDPTFEVINAGTYTLQIRNQSGCEISTTVVVGEDRALPAVDAGNDQNLGCLSEEARLGGTNNSTGSNFELTWTGGELNGTNQPNPIVRTAGNYILTIRNTQNGCVNSDSVNVTADDALITDILSQVDKPFCFGDENGMIQIDSVLGGNAPYVFAINNGSFSSARRFGNLAPATYQVKVRDASGCEFETEVVVENTLELQATLSADTEIKLGDSTVIDLIINPSPDSILRINWIVEDKSTCEGCLELGIRPSGKTTILVEIEDMNGCTATDLITLFVIREDKVFQPNVFSPNGQGENNFFYLSAGEDVAAINNFQIFDRWGMLVFEQPEVIVNDPTSGWDGTFQNKPLNPAVFVYRAEVTYADGRTEIIFGDVALVR